jgi:hypothetical protein
LGALSIVLSIDTPWSSVQARLCGDAVEDGRITVSDGVNVLRAAADLPSACDEDVDASDADGNGEVTV